MLLFRAVRAAQAAPRCALMPPKSRLYSLAETLEDPVEKVQLDLTDTGVATITLNSPETRNALSRDIICRLRSMLNAVSVNPKVRAVVIDANTAGTGVFCSGHNLKEMMHDAGHREQHEKLFRACSELMADVTRSSKAVVCKVDGFATAAGCQLVASCDMAFASEASRFSTPGVSIGLFCSTPAVPLVRAIGKKRALQMLLTGDPISAEQAAAWGLITDVVPASELDKVVQDTAEHIASKSTTAIAAGKQGFYAQIDEDLDTAYARASAVMVENMQSADAREGITAFLEKRAPKWE